MMKGKCKHEPVNIVIIDTMAECHGLWALVLDKPEFYPIVVGDFLFTNSLACLKTKVKELGENFCLVAIIHIPR